MEIKQISYQSTWPIRHQVMWPDKPIDYVKLSTDAEGLHLGLFVEDRLVSIVSAFLEKHVAQFRKFATLQEEQGKGYGSQLLSHLLSELKAMEVTRIWCNARAEKASYYQRFGLNQTDKYFSRGEIKYVIMEMEV